MWVSLEPKQGIRADAYPQEAQEKLNAAAPGSIVPLGASCFHATVHVRACGNHYQTTPAFEHKQAGYRSVKRLDVTDTEVKAYFATGRWTLHIDPACVQVKILPVPSVPNQIKWEWCMQTSIQRAYEKDWIPYDEEAQQLLEQAWKAGVASNVELQIGIRKYTVLVDPCASIMKQVNEDASKRRFVRRIARTSEHETSLKELFEKQKLEIGDNSCAICLNEFSETLSLPRMTTTCGHQFHATCIDPILQRGDKRCPMCRTAL